MRCAGSFLYENRDGATAAATVFIAFFTFTLWWSTTKMMEATRDSVELVRKELIADKRPRLHVRHVSVRIPLAVGPKRIEGSFIIVNRGGTEAKIIEGWVRFYWDAKGLLMQPPFADGQMQPLYHANERPILPGTSRFYRCEGIDLLSIKHREEIEQRKRKFYVMGYVKYADLNKDERFMGFCRVYEPPGAGLGDGRFIAVDDEVYEFQD
jgi:hypothetical protein